MTNRMSKLAAAVVLSAGLFLVLFGKFSGPTWALEQSIEALRGYRAIHIAGVFQGEAVEMWARANKTATQSGDVVVKGSRGTLMWTRDGSTYYYEPSQKIVYFEDTLTLGITQWLGPELLEMLRTAENTETVRGRDPATGRDRVTLLSSLIDANGAQSWTIEFDVASKLPVTLKQWSNLDRSGPPAFEAFKITYYEDLPDDLFAVSVPGEAKRVEKPLQIPDETVGILSNPEDGLSAEAMTPQEAAGQAVRVLYQAIIDQDLRGFKSICPLCRNWGDEFVRRIIFKPNTSDRIAEILEVGMIAKTGHSKLGPIVAVPTVFRLANGTKVAQKIIVQFRMLGGASSCIVYGPYGLAREIE